MLHSIIRLYAETVVRYRWRVLSAIVVITLGLILQLNKLKLDNDPDLWAPQHHDYIKTTHKLEALFGGRNFTVIGVMPKNGDIYNPATLQKIQHIQTAVEALPEAVKHNIVSLAASRVKDIKGDEEGLQIRNMLQPLPSTPEEMALMRQAIERNPIYINALVSPDGRAAAIVADFKIDKKNAAFAPLLLKLRAIANAEQDETTDIILGGQPIEAANFEFAMQEMPIYFGIAFLIIMAVQFFAFRSVQGMLLPMVTAILSVIWGLGLMALAGIHMDALNTTTPILIMAVATGHSVQILKRYYEELNNVITEQLHRQMDGSFNVLLANHIAIIRSLINVGPVMLTAGLVASIAFFSMQVSDVAMIRHFGFFAGFGVLAALMIEFTFIPALRAILPITLHQKKAQDSIDKLMVVVGHLLTQPNSSRNILLVFSLGIILVAVGAWQVKIDSSVKQYTAPESQIRQESTRLNTQFGGTDSIFLLIEGKNPDALKDPLVLKAMVKLQRFLEQQPGVGKTQSLADLIRRMNLAMNGEAPAFDTIPDDPNLIAQYLLLYTVSSPPEDFENLVDSKYQNAVIWAYLKTDSTAYAQRLWEKCQLLIQQEFPPSINVSIGGSLPQIIAVNDSLVTTKLHSIGQMAVVVFIMASLVFGSLMGGLMVVAPLAAIVIVNFGMMGWLGLPLDMGTAITAAMVTGIGADYEIYMLYRLREEYTRLGNLNDALRSSLVTSGKAVLFVALSIAGGYSALLFSDFRFYPRLGMTMIATMFISALLSLLLLRAVIALVKPAFIMGKSNKILKDRHLKVESHT